MIRTVAALLVAVLLPIQGFAAACAQICAANGKSHADMVTADTGEAGSHCHEVPAETPPAGDEGDLGHPGLAKCCQAHVFAFDGVTATAGPDASFDLVTPYLVRWRSFIADEVSPPPIAFTPA